MQVVLVCVLVLGCGSAEVGSPLPEPASGEVDIRAAGTVRSLSQRNDGEATAMLLDVRVDGRARTLLLLTGTGNDYDGIVVATRKERDTHGTYYSFAHHGARRLALKKSARGRWTAAVPDFNAGPVIFEDSAAAPIPVDRLIEQHRNDRASGRLEEIAPTTLAQRKSSQERLFAASAKSLASACGGMKSRIDWAGVDVSHFEAWKLGAQCGDAVYELEKFCRDRPDLVSEIAGSGPAVCGFGTEDVSFVRPGGNLEIRVPFRERLDSVEKNRLAIRRAFDETSTLLRDGRRFVLIRHDGKENRVYQGGAGDLYFYDKVSHEPRKLRLPMAAIRSTLEFDDSARTWVLSCDGAKRPMAVVPRAERKRLVAGLRVHEEPFWKREPYLLARDSKGSYYYIDRYRQDLGGKRHRVFIGRRGRMKLSKLKGIVEDSEGSVFSTGDGKLRLVVDGGRRVATWITGNKKLPLTTVPAASNLKLIYEDLGVYLGERVGHVCEY